MGQKLDDSAVVELTGKIMVIAIIVLFLVVFFVFFLHLYAKWFWYRREEDGPPTSAASTRHRRRRLEFSPGQEEPSPATDGLDPSVLKSIPVVKFTSIDFKDGLECAVCLSEIAGGEKIRLLPKCNHGFHVECIDMWFQSHSTCPLCRNPVSNQSSSNTVSTETSLEVVLENQRAEENSSVNGYSNNSTESSRSFPTNVLFWGNETQVSTLGACLEEDEEEDHHHHHHSIIASQNPSSSSSSSSSSSNRGDGALVVDIPRQMNEEDDTKSPIPTRMRSFKRLLSRDRRVNPCSPSNVDLEQLGRGQS